MTTPLTVTFVPPTFTIMSSINPDVCPAASITFCVAFLTASKAVCWLPPKPFKKSSKLWPALSNAWQSNAWHWCVALVCPGVSTRIYRSPSSKAILRSLLSEKYFMPYVPVVIMTYVRVGNGDRFVMAVNATRIPVPVAQVGTTEAHREPVRASPLWIESWEAP